MDDLQPPSSDPDDAGAPARGPSRYADRLLAEAGGILLSTLDDATALSALARCLTQNWARWCCFDRSKPNRGASRVLEPVALAHNNPTLEPRLREWRLSPLQNHSQVLEHVARTGARLFGPNFNDDVLQLDGDHLERTESSSSVGSASAMCVPLVAHGEVLGVMTLALSGGRPWSEADEWLAEEVARRAAQCLENAALYRRAQTALASAEEAAHARDAFLATVSHELRTPLTSIMGWANLLKSGRVDPATTVRALDTIERNVKAQAQIVEDLLDVSRIVAGKLRLEMRPLEFSSVISAAIEAVRPALSAKNIDIQLQVQGSPMVSGDPTRLQQIVWNILANAVRFTPIGGHIDMSVQLRSDVQPALNRERTSGGEGHARWNVVSLRVRDSGPGVPPEFAPHIFERFRQADSSTTRPHGGLGLGLAIVRNLAEMHGGEVRLEPPVAGEGACFVIELPLLEIPLSQIPKGEPQTDSFADLLLKNTTILLVEDEPDSRELLQVLLTRFGARVRQAASAREAWAALEEEQPDAIVSDIGMPDEDGYSLMRRVRQKWAINKLPSVALTAYTGDADRAQALEAGFNAHLPKPVSPIHLAMTLAGLIEHRA